MLVTTRTQLTVFHFLFLLHLKRHIVTAQIYAFSVIIFGVLPLKIILMNSVTPFRKLQRATGMQAGVRKGHGRDSLLQLTVPTQA